MLQLQGPLSRAAVRYYPRIDWEEIPGVTCTTLGLKETRDNWLSVLLRIAIAGAKHDQKASGVKGFI